MPAQLGSGRRWSTLQLPRLLRFLSRQLVVAAGSADASASIVNAWLECMWRPLVLISLEAAQESAATRQLLADALSATLVAIDVADQSRAPFAMAGTWPTVVTEIGHTPSLVIDAWGLNSADGHVSGPHGAEEAIRAPLLKLRARFAELPSQSEECEEDEFSELWSSRIRLPALARRERLREAFIELGVDTPAVVKSGTEAIRIRPSRAFFSQTGRIRRRLSLMALTPRRRQHQPQKKRSRKQAVSDDDSGEEPFARKTRVPLAGGGEDIVRTPEAKIRKGRLSEGGA